MFGRGGVKSSVLDRAKLQLSGQRISSSISQDKRHVGNFGTVVPQTRQTQLSDLSDVSSTSQSKNPDDPAKTTLENFSMGGGSRFLKKTSRDAAGDGRSDPGGTPARKDTSELIPQRSSQSTALSRLSLIEKRVKNQKGKEGGIQTEETRLSVQSSSEPSMTENRFLKRKTVSEYQDQTPLNSYTAVPGVNERQVRRFSPDSDEQDMQRLLGDSFSLSEDIVGKPASPQSVNKNQELHSQPSPKPPSSSRPVSRRVMFTERSVSSESDPSEIRSLDDLFPVAAVHDSDGTVSERSAASDDFKLHVMTLDDLAPVLSEAAEISHHKVKTKPKKGMNNISAVDSPEEISAAYESDFESEIPSEEPPSASEISERLTDDDRDMSLVSEARYSSSRSSGDSSSQFSSDVTVTRSRSPDRHVKEAAVQTQTDGLTYTWSSGMAAVGPSLGMTYVDPTPIAGHTISAEAIESVTSYSPAVVALNDMLRQQLALTRAFVDSARHHYTSMLESLGPADYKYTTLQDTKEYIRTHRPPKLSLEDALEEVLQEMRDYHYI